MATFLWVILRPLWPSNWTWPRLLTFVTLTSPPAALYAIPVEMFTSLETAQALNAGFLGVVAAWRVALLFWFLRRASDLPWYALVTGSLLPLAVVVTALASLNLEHVMFDLMAGIRPDQKTSSDTAYTIIVLLTWICLVALPVLVPSYLGIAWTRFRATHPKPTAAKR